MRRQFQLKNNILDSRPRGDRPKAEVGLLNLQHLTDEPRLGQDAMAKDGLALAVDLGKDAEVRGLVTSRENSMRHGMGD